METNDTLEIKAVIYDIGNVLAKDVWETLLPEIASEYALDGQKVRLIGELLWQAFAYRGETLPYNNWLELEKEYWRNFRKYAFGDQPIPATATIEKFIQKSNDFIIAVEPEPMTQVLESLREKGLIFAICSNNTEFWFRRQMENLHFYRFFNPANIILSCRTGVSKSSPRFEMFYALSDALHLSPKNCLFIDDRKRNVEKAVEYGMYGIQFKNAQDLQASLKTTWFSR